MLINIKVNNSFRIGNVKQTFLHPFVGIKKRQKGFFMSLFREIKHSVLLFCFVNRTVTSGGKPGREKVSTRPVKVRLTLTEMSCGGGKRML